MGVRALTGDGGGQGRYVVVGGAGFIGSHVVDRLLDDDATRAVVVYDNFSSGRARHLEHRRADARLTVIEGDAGDVPALADAVAGHGVVVHLAANPDIARAASEPAIDFDQGTVLTHGVLEAMRRAGTRRILYASGSGVYGDLGEREADEDTGPMRPISTYGASKLASEALIAAYCHMFGFSGLAFRMGNVVGPRQTHGVGLDFLAKLGADPGHLDILGDGRQSKSYIHVSDALAAIRLADAKCPDRFRAFNVATGDYITVKEIADLAVECLGLKAGSVAYRFTGGDRGWKGDVPVVRLDCRRIRDLGWTCRLGSRDAMRAALKALAEDARIADAGAAATGTRAAP
ncbi:MAG TPA: NAD-dependent epimerase/dehydratase family protein [Rhodospirillales bacterium]